MYTYHSILECCNLFSGVGLSNRFALFGHKKIHCDFWLFLVEQKISSDSMCLVYTLAIKTNHRGNGALFQFSLNSLQIFQLVRTGFGHKNMK